MILVDSIKNSFRCVIENPSIALFLVLFLIGANLLASFIITAKTTLLANVFLLCLLALISVFLSGWLKVIKESSDRLKIKEKNFYSLFLEGIGENIIPASLGILIYTVFVFIFVIIAQFAAMHFFGDISFFLDSIDKITIENTSFAQYFNNLDINQKYILYGWNICIMISVAVFNFLSLFYFPALFNSNKKAFLRPFVCVWEALLFLFKNFFPSVAINFFIYALYLFLAILSAKFSSNTILAIVLLFIRIYLISYVVMLIFNYYEAKNNSSDGSDSIGQDETVNSISEEN